MVCAQKNSTCLYMVIYCCFFFFFFLNDIHIFFGGRIMTICGSNTYTLQLIKSGRLFDELLQVSCQCYQEMGDMPPPPPINMCSINLLLTYKPFMYDPPQHDTSVFCMYTYYYKKLVCWG